jgi:hypothetical protein
MSFRPQQTTAPVAARIAQAWSLPAAIAKAVIFGADPSPHPTTGPEAAAALAPRGRPMETMRATNAFEAHLLARGTFWTLNKSVTERLVRVGWRASTDDRDPGARSGNLNIWRI